MVDNYPANPKGRLWILWDPNVVLFRPEIIHQQCIYGFVSILQSNTGFYFTGMYGLHTIADKKNLWNDLGSITSEVTEPLIIMGDFNSILYADDRVGRAPVIDSEVADFKQYLEVT